MSDIPPEVAFVRANWCDDWTEGYVAPVRQAWVLDQDSGDVVLVWPHDDESYFAVTFDNDSRGRTLAFFSTVTRESDGTFVLTTSEATVRCRLGDDGIVYELPEP